MRLAVYSLAAVMIAGLAVGIAFSYAPVAKVQNVARDRGTVYVDPVPLMKLHPSWQALDTMKKTLADMGSVESGAPAGVGDVKVSHVPMTETASGDSLLREQLRTQVAREAVSALGDLETERRQALQSRIHTMRGDMVDESQRKLRLQEQEVQAQVSDQLRTVAEENVYDRINAQLKLSALKAAGRTKGVDSKMIETRIESAQSELNRVNRISTAQSDEVLAQAAASIDKLSNDAQTKIDATLSIYESGENRRIEQQVAEARDQILSELDSNVADAGKGSLFANPPASTTPVAHVTGDSSRPGIDSAAADFRGRIKRLEAQIRSDVTRAARRIGAEKNVKVVFVPGSGYKDRTDDFARSMRGLDWGAYTPVMLDALGS